MLLCVGGVIGGWVTRGGDELEVVRADGAFDRVRGCVDRDLQLLVPQFDLQVLESSVRLIYFVIDLHALLPQVQHRARQYDRQEDAGEELEHGWEAVSSELSVASNKLPVQIQDAAYLFLRWQLATDNWQLYSVTQPVRF